MSNLVAVVGAPNVGKSTLFNRLTAKASAIVEDIPGVTRDRIYGDVDWSGRSFKVIDTGGLGSIHGEDIAVAVKEQVETAIDEADVVVLVVNGQLSPTTEDESVANLLLRLAKPTVLAVNKIDNRSLESSIYEFYSLGLGEPVAISALHGRNSEDLLDRILDHLSPNEDSPADEEAIRVAVVGRPNVGKSELTNRILGYSRATVGGTPGTTRDALDTPLEHDGEHLILIDTAGIRRKSRVAEGVERYSVIRSIRAIERSDVALIMIDATDLLVDQDLKISSLAHEAGCGSVILVNKWDLVTKDNYSVDEYTKAVRKWCPFMDYAPLIFISALTGVRVNKVLSMAIRVAAERSRRIETGILNKALGEAIDRHNPPTYRGKRLKIYYLTQTAIKPPTFALIVNEPKSAQSSYIRYIGNTIRRDFGFVGTPIRINLRRRK